MDNKSVVNYARYKGALPLIRQRKDLTMIQFVTFPADKEDYIAQEVYTLYNNKNNSYSNYKVDVTVDLNIENDYILIDMGRLNFLKLYPRTLICIRKGGILTYWIFTYISDCDMAIYCTCPAGGLTYKLEVSTIIQISSTLKVESIICKLTYISSRDDYNIDYNFDKRDLIKMKYMLDYFRTNGVYPTMDTVLFSSSLNHNDWFLNLSTNVKHINFDDYVRYSCSHIKDWQLEEEIADIETYYNPFSHN